MRTKYRALGVPFNERGKLLDEQLAAWEQLWREGPASFHGDYYSFDDVYLEPKPYRASGPRLWFGGQSLHTRLLQRLLRYGHGFHPLGAPSDADLERLAAGMRDAGRDIAELDMVGGVRAVFPDDDSPADLGAAIDSIAAQWERGFRIFCIKPNQFLDDAADIGSFFRDIVRRTEAIAG